ncbi:hypothetical protein [Mycolicibacterium sp. 624]|uniref:hypothetical protein n=1 Tax=Mycolicibacterium sp. 624 TaxID=3156314 RepID=UPI00339557BE
MIGEQDPAGASVLKGIQQVVAFDPVLGDIQFQTMFEAVLLMVGGVPDAFSGTSDAESGSGEVLYRFYWVRQGGFGAATVLRPEGQDRDTPLAVSGWIRPLSAVASTKVDVSITGQRVIREYVTLSRRVELCWSEEREADVVLDATGSMHEMSRPALEALIDLVLEAAYGA